VIAPLRGAVARLQGAADRVHERAFVAGYTRVQGRSETAGMREVRRELVADARGRVLEVGAGTGLNLAHYGPRVDELVLVEPAAAMRAELARVPAGPDAPPRTILDGTGEALPVDDASVDVVVGTFVLCSVVDPAAVLREVARVLRPGGRYLGLEHVRAPTDRAARAQDVVAPAWRWMARGCRPNQDVVALVVASPLAVERAEAFAGPGQPWPVRPAVRIAARRP
jgi:ubiquinone/menaquinone biosynthesis C-methylase UbiE